MSADVDTRAHLGDEEFPSLWYDLSSTDHFWFVWRLKCFLQRCARLGIDPNSPKRGLEIGCGNGLLIEQLDATTNWVVDGIDINKEAIQRARPIKGRIQELDVFAAPPEMQASYDFVVLFDVIEHLDDPSEFVAQAAKLIKPGGHLFINVPALESLFSAYDEAAGHFRRYNKQTLGEAMAQQGLILRMQSYWGLLLLPILVVRNLMTSFISSRDEIIRRGFEPPHGLVNSCLKLWMRVELALFKNPWLGTSLLYVGEKRRG